MFFEQERRLRCAITRERDIVGSAVDPARRTAAAFRLDLLTRQLPQSQAEALLLIHG